MSTVDATVSSIFHQYPRVKTFTRGLQEKRDFFFFLSLSSNDAFTTAVRRDEVIKENVREPHYRLDKSERTIFCTKRIALLKTIARPHS